MRPEVQSGGRHRLRGLGDAGLLPHREVLDDVAFAEATTRVTVTQDEGAAELGVRDETLEHNRVIPSEVKVGVYQRDDGQCVRCGAKDNLHFDHVLPFSRGGTSLRSENIQLLCARHNLEKAARIE